MQLFVSLQFNQKFNVLNSKEQERFDNFTRFVGFFFLFLFYLLSFNVAFFLSSIRIYLVLFFRVLRCTRLNFSVTQALSNFLTIRFFLSLPTFICQMSFLCCCCTRPPSTLIIVFASRTSFISFMFCALKNYTNLFEIHKLIAI